MNVYDEVNGLARAIKESKEKIRYEEQLLAMQGEKQTEDKMKKLQELYEILVKDNMVKDYFDKEVRFNVLIADVNKIIGDAIKDVL